MKINNWVFVPFGATLVLPIAARVSVFLCGAQWDENVAGFTAILGVTISFIAVSVTALYCRDTDIGHTDLRKLWGWWK